MLIGCSAGESARHACYTPSAGSMSPTGIKQLPFEARPDAVASPAIPNRSLFKASEVCELARLQPYILRSWEAEFINLGVSRTPGSPRVYRRADVERVFEIKRLLFEEGLTLAGVRRRLEEDPAPVEGPPIEALLGSNARERLGEVKRGLRALLELLSRDAPAGNGHAPSAASARATKTAARSSSSRSSRPAKRSAPTARGRTSKRR